MATFVAFVLVFLTVFHLFVFFVESRLSIVEVDDWHDHNVLFRSVVFLKLSQANSLSFDHFVPNLLEIVILNVLLHLFGDLLEIWFCHQISPFTLFDNERFYVMFDLVTVEGLLIESTVESSHNTSFLESQAILSFLVQFKSDIDSSIHNEVKFVCFL